MTDLAVARREYLCWLAEDGPAEDFGGHVNVKLMHDWCMAQVAAVPIAYLEFGVYRGRSVRWWVAGNTNSRSRFYGFDSFHGLAEPWETPGGLHEPGYLTRHGEVPQIPDERLRFYAGDFALTLPPFFAAFASKYTRVVHVDCDLYSSATCVFTHLRAHLRPGDFIIMDEAGNGDEFAAFRESGIAARPVAFAGCACIAKVA